MLKAQGATRPGVRATLRLKHSMFSATTSAIMPNEDPRRLPHAAWQLHSEASGWDRPGQGLLPERIQPSASLVARVGWSVHDFSVKISTTRDIDDVCSRAQSSKFPCTERPAHFLGVAHAKHQNVRYNESLVPLLDGEAPGLKQFRNTQRRTTWRGKSLSNSQ